MARSGSNRHTIAERVDCIAWVDHDEMIQVEILEGDMHRACQFRSIDALQLHTDSASAEEKQQSSSAPPWVAQK